MNINKDLYKRVKFCQRCGAELKIRQDREGKLRPHCNNCNWIYYKNPIPVAACVILNEKNEVVIIKRRFEPKPGTWALPSGYIEINQTPEEAAIQEMKEETNLEGEIVEFIDYKTGYSPLYHRVVSFGFLMKIKSGNLLAGDDASEAKFVPIEKLGELAFSTHNYFVDRVKGKFNL